MNKIVTCVFILSIGLIQACSKSNNGSGSGGNTAPKVTSADLIKTYKANGTASGYRLDAGIVQIPLSGTNKSFNYSNNPTGTPWTETFGTPTVSAFSGATYTIGFTNNLGGQTLAISRYYQINTSSWSVMGDYYSAATLSIPGTGTAAIPAQAVAQTPTLILANLPITYGDSTNQTCNSKLTFSATLTGFPFPLPGEIRQEIKTTNNVFAWGNLKVRGYTDSMPTVVQRFVTSIKTNYFLSGSPAPTALLNSLGVTDGQIVNNTAYRFFVPGKGLVMTVNADGSATVTTGL